MSSELVRRPSENAISEGNLVETPLFVLSNKDAKPADKAAYTKVISLGTIIEGGRAIERAVKLNASTSYGYPTMFAYRVLVAIIHQARNDGFLSPNVTISRHQIARALGYKTPGKREYEDIENACNAMAAMYIQFRGSWYDKKSKASFADRDGLHILDRVQFRDGRQAILPGLEDNADAGSVTLGQAFYASLRDGYYVGIDLDYLNALKDSSLALKLYSYLTKKDGDKHAFTIGLREMARRCNLKKTKPSALYSSFAAALALLAKPLPTGPRGEPRQFLESWTIDKEKLQMTVVFFRKEASAPGRLVAGERG